jgi:hypothetical protein
MMAEEMMAEEMMAEEMMAEEMMAEEMMAEEMMAEEVVVNTSPLEIPKELEAYKSAIQECLNLYAEWGVTLDHLIEMANSYSKSSVLSKYQGENLTRFFNVHQEDWLTVWTTLSQADAMLIS